MRQTPSAWNITKIYCQLCLTKLIKLQIYLLNQVYEWHGEVSPNSALNATASRKMPGLSAKLVK